MALFSKVLGKSLITRAVFTDINIHQCSPFSGIFCKPLRFLITQIFCELEVQGLQYVIFTFFCFRTFWRLFWAGLYLQSAQPPNYRNIKTPNEKNRWTLDCP